MTENLTPKIKLHIEQGVDFDHTFQWLAGGIFMAPIEEVHVGYPTVLIVTGHGLNTRSAQPIIISGIDGCPHINTDDVGIPLCSRVDANTISVPLTTVGDDWVEGTGEITYHMPSDLTDMTARMVIKKNWHATAAIHELTTANGGIILTTEDAGIALHISKADTAAFVFKNAWYDVDLTHTPTGSEYRIFRGPVELYREM